VRGWFNSLCPAPIIDDAAGKKHAGCLSTPWGGRVSACSGRFGDAQGEAGRGRFLLVRFSFARKKMNERKRSFSLHPPVANENHVPIIDNLGRCHHNPVSSSRSSLRLKLDM
jgi:hypothetical protein